MPKSLLAQLAELDTAIAAQETLRGTLDDAVLETILATLRAQKAALEQQIVSRQQRKMVTVLFADVSGYTAMSENMDPEEITLLMNRIWERLDRAILENGGQIDKHLGDGVMALWGADEAREDNPEQAVLAGLSIQKALSEFCAGNSLSLSMRVGINTGLAIVGEVGSQAERTVMGDAVNVASRLEKAAPPGGVLISHDTFRHVRGVFDVEVRPPLEVKGKSEPLQTYLVLSAREHIFRLPSRGIEGIETRMIGRDAELEQLAAALESVSRQSGITFITIVGDAGIGKSRLLYEFEKWFDLSPLEAYYFKGRATLQTRATPYGLLRDLFAYRFGILESDSAQAVRRKFESEICAVLRDDGLFKAQIIGTLLGYDFSESPLIRDVCGDVELLRRRALQYIGEFFAALSLNDPVLMVLEDIHWADRPSLAALRTLAMEQTTLRLLAVCLARPTLYEHEPAWDSVSERSLRLDLKPLDPQQSDALVGEILQKVENLPEELRALVARNAEGNPFYVEELIKVLLDDGVILRGAECWQVDLSRLSGLRIPPTLTAVLQARLDSLQPAERLILQRASVVGRMFWDAPVAVMSDDLAPVMVADRLGTLSQRELIYQHHKSAFDGAHEFAFKHAILRDVTYESVLKKDRRAYHLRVARWLENATRASGRTAEYYSVIASHYEQAGESEKAVEYLSHSAERSFQLAEFSDAVEIVDHALALIADDPNLGGLRARLLVQKGNIFSEKGAYADARRYLEPGLELARQAGDQKTIAKALGHLGRILNWLGEYDPARAYLREAYQIVRSGNDLAGQIFISRQLGNVAIVTGEHQAAVRHLNESLSLARSIDDLDSAAAALNSLGENAYAENQPEAALEFYQQAFDLACKVGNRSDMAMIRANMGAIYLQRGDYATCRAQTLEALALARAIESLWMTAAALHVLGTASIYMQDETSALAHLSEATRLMRQIGSEAFLTSLLPDYALILHRRGQTERALALLGLALTHPACESDTRLEIERILTGWGMLGQMETLTTLAVGLDLHGEIASLQEIS
jgi:class 3 adenylate cyclase/tetratricopeptide (TPR) repeat protein